LISRKKGLLIDVATAPTTVLALGNGPLLSATLSFLSSRAKPDFLLHCSHRRPGCGSLQREPHAADRSRNSRQEIRRSRGICSSADLSWKCFSIALRAQLSSSLPWNRSAAQWRDLRWREHRPDAVMSSSPLIQRELDSTPLSTLIYSTAKPVPFVHQHNSRLVAIEKAADHHKQPDFARPTLSSRQSTTYIVKK
jgi:hypothetical protein